MLLTLTDSNFQKEISDFKGIIMVDFWAAWCGPCRIQGPIVEKLAQKYENNSQVKIGKLDVENNRNIQAKYSIMSIPTIIFFKNGEIIDLLVGLHNAVDLDLKLSEFAK